MTTLSVVPEASSVLRLLGTKHDTSSWRGTWHHALQKGLAAGHCVLLAGGPWLSWGLSALDRLWGQS